MAPSLRTLVISAVALGFMLVLMQLTQLSSFTDSRNRHPRHRVNVPGDPLADVDEPRVEFDEPEHVVTRAARRVGDPQDDEANDLQSPLLKNVLVVDSALEVEQEQLLEHAQLEEEQLRRQQDQLPKQQQQQQQAVVADAILQQQLESRSSYQRIRREKEKQQWLEQQQQQQEQKQPPSKQEAPPKHEQPSSKDSQRRHQPPPPPQQIPIIDTPRVQPSSPTIPPPPPPPPPPKTMPTARKLLDSKLFNDLHWRPTCERQRIAPRPDVKGGVTLWYLEPWLAPSALGSGITLSMQSLFALLAGAVGRGDVLYVSLPQLPDCSPVCSSETGMGIDELIDIAALTDSVNAMRTDSGLAPMVIATNMTLLESVFPNAAIAKAKMTTADAGSRKLLLLSSMRPSKCLEYYLDLMEEQSALVTATGSTSLSAEATAALVARGSATKQQPEKRLCIHQRIEDDFRCWFLSAPGYYTTEQIAKKVNHALHNVAELADVETLYLAGAYDYDDVLATMSLGTNRSVTTKRLLLSGKARGERTPDIEYNCEARGVNDPRAPKEYANTFYAMLDFFFCAKSGKFIGNNHSSWSGVVFDWLAGRKHREQTPYVARQVNDLIFGYTDTTHSFCEPNWSSHIGPGCNYYRIN